MDASLIQRNEAPKSFKNPLQSDFSVEYLDDTNARSTYTIKAGQIVTYPTYLADFLIKHLADSIIWDRGEVPTELSRKKISEEITNVIEPQVEPKEDQPTLQIETATMEKIIETIKEVKKDTEPVKEITVEGSLEVDFIKASLEPVEEPKSEPKPKTKS